MQGVNVALMGFPSSIRATVGGAFTPGTIVRIFEHTANTPFSSAVEVARGENQTVFNIPRRDTTTRYYWARTELSGQNSTTYPSGNGTVGAGDRAQSGDIAPNAVTAVFTHTDTNPYSNVGTTDAILTSFLFDFDTNHEDVEILITATYDVVATTAPSETRIELLAIDPFPIVSLAESLRFEHFDSTTRKMTQILSLTYNSDTEGDSFAVYFRGQGTTSGAALGVDNIEMKVEILIK